MNVIKIAAALRQLADAVEESEVMLAPPEGSETRTESQSAVPSGRQEEAPSFAQYRQPKPEQYVPPPGLPAGREPEPEEETDPLAQSFSAIPVTTADITEAFNNLAGRVGQPRAKEIVVEHLKALGLASFGSGTDTQKSALYQALLEAK